MKVRFQAYFWHLWLPPFLIILMDQISKNYMVAHGGDVVLNHGIIGGFLENAPIIYRRVFVSTIYALVLFVFIFTQYILLRKSWKLTMSISIFFAGITSNAMDRIWHGVTVDFIHGMGIVFNFADVFQWVGLVGAILATILDWNLIFFPKNTRAQFLIDPKFQIKLAGEFSFASLTTSLATGIMSYTFFLSVSKTPPSDEHMYFFIVSYVLLSVLFSVIVFLMALFITQKTAGPVYAFNRFLNNMLQGSREPLRLRNNDDFKCLEDSSRKLLAQTVLKKTPVRVKKRIKK